MANVIQHTHLATHMSAGLLLKERLKHMHLSLHKAMRSEGKVGLSKAPVASIFRLSAWPLPQHHDTAIDPCRFVGETPIHVTSRKSKQAKPPQTTASCGCPWLQMLSSVPDGDLPKRPKVANAAERPKQADDSKVEASSCAKKKCVNKQTSQLRATCFTALPRNRHTGSISTSN